MLLWFLNYEIIVTAEGKFMYYISSSVGLSPKWGHQGGEDVWCLLQAWACGVT